MTICPQTFIEQNYQFHFMIYQESQSSQLISIIENLWLNASPYFHYLREVGFYKKSENHHKEIVAGIVDGDRQRAVQAIKDDIYYACKAILKANIISSS